MIFEIDFNRTSNDEFLIDKLGAKWTNKGSEYDVLTVNINDFNHLKGILDIVDEHLSDFYSAVISFDPPTIYLDNKV